MNIQNKDSNQQDTAAYKKTSDGKTEFTGPLTDNEFTSTEIYKGLIENAYNETDGLNTPAYKVKKQVEKHIFGDPTPTGLRFVIQSDVIPGENGKPETTVARKIISGIVNSESGDMEVLDISDLKTGAVTHVQGRDRSTEAKDATESGIGSENGMHISLDSKGNLTQPAADNLASKLEFVPGLYITQPQSTKDGRTIVQGPLNAVETNALGINEFRNSDMYRQLQSTEQGRAKLDAIQSGIAAGEFKQILIVSDQDAEGRNTTRLLLGNRAESDTRDPITGDSVYISTFRESFNLETGKASVLEKPVSMSTTSEKRTSQNEIERVATEVRTAVSGHEISMREGGNALFDELLAKGASAQPTAAEGDFAVPAVPFASGKIKGVA